MTKYQLAKLIEWVGRVDTRKRMQKVVYLLQISGCPFNADFFLHRFGPYSHDVARITEELVSEAVLQEDVQCNAAGHQYSYRLTEHGRKLLAAYEGRSAAAKDLAPQMGRFEHRARSLADEDLRKLEVASTIAYFYQSSHDWSTATIHACRFKAICPDAEFARLAESLARTVTEEACT